jgi:ABC-type branched-subunit amino acid transport system substrate-binding protein
MSEGQYVVAYSYGQRMQLALKLARQREMRERLAGVAAGKAWNADMVARKAAKGGKA